MSRLDFDDSVSAFTDPFSSARWETQRSSDERMLRHYHHQVDSEHGSPTLNVANPSAVLDFGSPYIAVPQTGSRRDDESIMSRFISDTYYTPDRFMSEFEEYEKIGHGDFGAVNAATCCADRQRYAIKQSRKPVVGDSDLQHRLQEVYALSAIGPSPHVLRYHDAWVEEGRLFISTELVEGGSARNLFGHGEAWDERTLWELALQAGVGLQTIHSSNVAHLDIKPDNILCSHDPETGNILFKIGDFGLARPLHVDQVAGAYQGLNDDEGDSRYVCPALLQQPRNPQLQEADVFALGMTLFDLAVPHADLKYIRLSRDLSALEARELSPAFVQLITDMTDPTPANRPTAYDVIARAIEARMHFQPSPVGELDYQELQSKMATVAALRKELQALQEAGSPTPWHPQHGGF